MKRVLLASALSLALTSPAFAAIEIDENDFGPTYGSTVADLTVGKPLQLVGAIGGTALHIAALPFSVVSGSVGESYQTLVAKPWSNLRRCNGCTPSYDHYVKSQNRPEGEIRFVVDRPSEIVIHTDGRVTVDAP